MISIIVGLPERMSNDGFFKTKFFWNRVDTHNVIHLTATGLFFLAQFAHIHKRHHDIIQDGLSFRRYLKIGLSSLSDYPKSGSVETCDDFLWVVRMLELNTKMNMVVPTEE
jgi:hypothetical protein